MERIKNSNDTSVKAIKGTRIIDKIIPLYIENFTSYGTDFCHITFLAEELCTESNYFVKTRISINNKNDKEFLKIFPLYKNNVDTDSRRKEFVNSIEQEYDADNEENIYYSDLIFTEDNKHKTFYISNGSRNINGVITAEELLVTQDIFVQLELFFLKLSEYNKMAGVVFGSKKLTNTSMVLIDHVKYNGTSTDLNWDVVISHFTSGRGPQTFKFSLLNKKEKERKMKNPIIQVDFKNLYGKSFIINEYFIVDNKVYALYEERSPITDQFKSTKILIFDEELCKSTSFKNTDVIYYTEEES